VRTRVKVCCITNPDAAALAIRYGADALGLVGPMPSGTGIIDLATAARLAGAVPPPVASFLLSSATAPDELLAQCRQVAPTTLQIVDQVDPAAYALLRGELPALRLVQVVHVTGERTIDEALAVASLVDALLLDSGSPDAPVRLLGGTGKVHDWAISRRIVCRTRDRSPLLVRVQIILSMNSRLAFSILSGLPPAAYAARLAIVKICTRRSFTSSRRSDRPEW